MARLDGVSADAWRITAYVPSLLFARGALEIILERSNLTDRRIRKLAELKTAMLIGCPS
jgi:hypothetical protein